MVLFRSSCRYLEDSLCKEAMTQHIWDWSATSPTHVTTETKTHADKSHTYFCSSTAMRSVPLQSYSCTASENTPQMSSWQQSITAVIITGKRRSWLTMDINHLSCVAIWAEHRCNWWHQHLLSVALLKLNHLLISTANFPLQSCRFIIFNISLQLHPIKTSPTHRRSNFFRATSSKILSAASPECRKLIFSTCTSLFSAESAPLSPRPQDVISFVLEQ